MRVANRNILVVGLARSGLAAANFLLARGARVTITDIKRQEALQEPISQLQGSARLSLGGHRLEDFLNADMIVLSPGVTTQLPELLEATRQDIPIYSEVELAYRFLQGRVIGVTGSNGKTTTTTLIGELLRKSKRPCVVAGNIGSPLIHSVEAPDASQSPDTNFVVELSSFQLETIERFRCNIALLLNITPDHQDRYRRFEDYIEAKQRIFLRQTSEDFAILNADNPHTRRMRDQLHSSVLLFSRKQSLEEGVFVQKGMIQANWSGRRLELMSIQEIRLPGNHNLENVLAAATVGLVLGLDPQSMVQTFQSFAGVEHRLELVRQWNGVSFYNDSKATNIDSASQALQAFTEPLLLIMGGQDKGGDFEKLHPLISGRVKLLILIGSAGDQIAGQLQGAAEIVRARDMKEAVRFAQQGSIPGDVVLLSPGCASFDMFDDFEHRGRAFKQAVKQLGSVPAPSDGSQKQGSQNRDEPEHPSREHTG